MEDILGRIRYQIERTNNTLRILDANDTAGEIDKTLHRELRIMWDIVQDMAVRMKLKPLLPGQIREMTQDEAAHYRKLTYGRTVINRTVIKPEAEHKLPCGCEWRRTEDDYTGPIFWNPLNEAVICHICGQQFAAPLSAEKHKEDIQAKARAGAKALFEAGISGDWRTAEGLEQMAAILAKAWEPKG